MNKFSASLVVCLVSLAACGPQLALPAPVAIATPVTDAAADTTPADAVSEGECDPGESRQCEVYCFGGGHANGLQYCGVSRNWEPCVVTTPCFGTPPEDASTPAADASQDAEAAVEDAVPPTDAAPDTSTPDASAPTPEVSSLVEVGMFNEYDTRYPRASLAPGARGVALGTLNLHRIDPSVDRLRVTFEVTPLDGSRIFGSQGSGYLSNPFISGGEPVGWTVSVVDGREIFRVTLEFNPQAFLSLTRPAVTVIAATADWEDAEGEFTTRESSYQMSIVAIEASASGSPIVSERIRVGYRTGSRNTIGAYEGPSCGAAPLPALLQPRTLSTGNESETEQAYEIEIRPYGRYSIIGGELRFYFRDDRTGVFQQLTGASMPLLRGTGVEANDRMADWLNCERRRGHVTSLRYRFALVRGMQFAIYPNFVAEQVDDDAHGTRVVTLGSADLRDPEVCSSSGDGFIVRRCTGDLCDRELVPGEIRNDHLSLMTHSPLGSSVGRVCMYRTFF